MRFRPRLRCERGEARQVGRKGTKWLAEKPEFSVVLILTNLSHLFNLSHKSYDGKRQNDGASRAKGSISLPETSGTNQRGGFVRRKRTMKTRPER